MSRLEAAKLAGILAGALLGAVVASRMGVRWPMVLQAVPLALSGFVALSLTEILDRSLVAALVFVGMLGLAAAVFARAPASLFEGPRRAPAV